MEWKGWRLPRVQFANILHKIHLLRDIPNVSESQRRGLQRAAFGIYQELTELPDENARRLAQYIVRRSDWHVVEQTDKSHQNNGNHMFTGIITHLGKVVDRNGSRFTFQADKVFCKKLEKGTSVCVNGACLTATHKGTDNFSVTVMPETAKKTIFRDLQKNNPVNLELSVTPETLLSGHIVQGHVDGVGIITNIEPEGNSRLFTFEIPKELGRYIVEKGSIAVNGISLTVIDAKDTYFTVGIIPYTWDHTMLHTAKIGDKVNIETDILAKYMEKLLKK